MVEDSVIVRSSSDVAEGTISSKYVEEAASVTVVDEPVKVARVVIVAVGMRQATVPGWSITIESRSASPPVIFKLLQVFKSSPMQCHNRNASPFGTAKGIANAATWSPPRHDKAWKPK
jgi:hypothetical protein